LYFFVADNHHDLKLDNVCTHTEILKHRKIYSRSNSGNIPLSTQI